MKSHFSLILLSTLQCNADCEYCFENKTDDRLTLALWRSLTEEARSPTSLAPGSGGVNDADPGPSHPLRMRVESFERAIIRQEFDAANKNQSETARRLGVSRPALIEKLHKYELIPQNKPNGP